MPPPLASHSPMSNELHRTIWYPGAIVSSKSFQPLPKQTAGTSIEMVQASWQIVRMMCFFECGTSIVYHETNFGFWRFELRVTDLRMNRPFFFHASVLLFLTLTPACDKARAQYVDVFLAGEVEFNQIGSGILGQVSSGDLATLSFQVDPVDFMDGPNFPTRGYAILDETFMLAFGDGEVVMLQSPTPSTSYFVLRNNDPAVDGFFISTNVKNPIGVPLDQVGVIDQFRNNFSVTFVGETLGSLDILEAVGNYDFAGLTVFNWTIDDGPFNAMGIVFSELFVSLGGDCDFELGDVNNDGLVDILDVAPFVDALLLGDPNCAADINGDGFVDLLDVEPFVKILIGG